MCARMVWVFDEAKGVWVQRVVFTPEAQWELEGVEEYRLPATYYNVTPTYNCAILRVDDAHRTLRFERARWGISGGKGMGHNAKVESLRKVPSWRQMFGTTHAVVVADGFYEWDDRTGRKQPYYFHRKDGQPLTFAALYTPPAADEQHPEVTIVTCPPNRTMMPYHDRMPVVIEPSKLSTWLQPADVDEDELLAMLVPCADDVLDVYPVSTDVNKSVNSWPQLLDPVKVPGGQQQALF